MMWQQMIKMGNLYYKIWVDAIVYEKTKHGHLRNWKPYTLIPISVLQGVNLLTIFFWLSTFNLKIDIFLDFDLFPGILIDGFLSGFVTLFLPFILLNWLLIFRGKKFESLIKKYEYKKGKLYLIYFLTSIVVFILPIIIGKWIL
jgi:hypothetical protein